jgi:RNA polymerase sigma-70 factor (ECF subfamily)
MTPTEYAHGERAAPLDSPGDEARLMSLARATPEAFAPLYERYFPRVYAYCLRRVNEPQEAEDLCSQVFTQALAGLHSYRGGMVSAWLFRIAHNVVVNHYRARRVVIPLDTFEAADDKAGAHLEQIESSRFIDALLASLPDDQRDLLALTVDAGLTSEEAGAALGKSAGAVRVQLHRIMKHLRHRYELLTGEGSR